jgi:hypothetical protein
MVDRGYLDVIEIESLLVCAKLPITIIRDLMNMIKKRSDIFTVPVALEDWLIICKLVSLFQTSGSLDIGDILLTDVFNTQTDSDKMKVDTSKGVTFPLADFGFNDFRVLNVTVNHEGTYL